MPKYKVFITRSITESAVVTITAPNPKSAKIQALAKAHRISLPWTTDDVEGHIYISDPKNDIREV